MILTLGEHCIHHQMESVCLGCHDIRIENKLENIPKDHCRYIPTIHLALFMEVISNLFAVFGHMCDDLQNIFWA